MEKRNRLDRRGQSPPPESPRVNAARVAAVLALATAFVVVVLVIAASLGVGQSILVGIGVLTSVSALLAAGINLRTALINNETVRLELRLAEEATSVSSGERLSPAPRRRTSR
jgi:hypothetical protein